MSPIGLPAALRRDGEATVMAASPGERAWRLMRASTPDPESWAGGAFRSTAEAPKEPSVSGVGSEALRTLLWLLAAWKNCTLMLWTLSRTESYKIVANQPLRSVTLVMKKSTLKACPALTGAQLSIVPSEVALLPVGLAATPRLVTIGTGVGVGVVVGVGVPPGQACPT